MKDPDILNVSFSRTIPFSGNIGGYFGWEDSQPEERVLTSRNYVTDDFFDTYGIRLLQGRNFAPGSGRDEYPVIINETALKTFGWKDPIGKNVIYFEKPHQVIGVVNDFHAYSIHQPIPVYIFIPSVDTINGDGYYTVRFSPGSMNRVKKYLQEEMGVFYPESAFEFNDLESTILQDRALRTYRSFGRISMSYTILTIMIAAIGLFGLILFSVKRRTKEIGIRKVMGSSVLSIFRLLTMEVLKLIGVAIIIVVPLAWYEHDLLPSYYKPPLTVLEFIVAISALVLVSLVTISWHLFQAARVNPVEALRYE